MRCRSSAWSFIRTFILQDFFYRLGTPVFRNTWECCSYYSFFFFDCSVSRIYSLLFLQKIRRPVLLSYNPITFNSKFANRNSCGYCFRHPGKTSTKTSALKFSVKLLPANIGFVNYSGLKFFPDFQSTEKLSRGVLQK